VPAGILARARARIDTQLEGASGPDVPPEPEGPDMTFLWILLGVLYLVLLISLGLATLRNGHYVLFIVGIFFPLLWIIGAVIAPTTNARAAGAH
jgi:hypothetical protein